MSAVAAVSRPRLLQQPRVQANLRRLIPFGLLLGMAAEGFMNQTNFYDVVTRKEAERRLERDAAERQYWAERQQREQAQPTTVAPALKQ